MEIQSDGRRAARKPARDGEVRLRKGQYLGRNGEVLTRDPVRNGNKYDFPEHLKEEGWSYQWIRHSVYNDVGSSEMSLMKRSGWREVDPKALKGYYSDIVQPGASHIEMEGLVLVERPEVMTLDAKAEMERAAHESVARQYDACYDKSTPMHSGLEAHMRQVQFERPVAAPQDWKPGYTRVEPAPDEE